MKASAVTLLNASVHVAFHVVFLDAMFKFSVVGDSNVRRHLTSFSSRNNQMMSGAEVKICGSLSVFDETLRSISFSSTACILACLTNFLTSSSTDGPSSSAAVRVEPTLLEVRDIIWSFCQEQPDRQWFLSPPMYRTTPVWYMDGIAQILMKFSEVFRVDKPANLYLLPSFSSPSLESDGVHLDPFSGCQYVVSLFDQAVEAAQNSRKPVTALAALQQESIRSLEDRMVVLEQDHYRLNRSVETKSVVSSESSDFAENQRYF